MYFCSYCNYTTKIKCNFIKHHSTKKHLFNVNKTITNENHKKLDPPKSQIGGKLEGFAEKKIPKSAKINENPESKLYKCEKCSKTFTRKDNLKRHQDRRCKIKVSTEPISENIEIKITEPVLNSQIWEEKNNIVNLNDSLDSEQDNETTPESTFIINSMKKENLDKDNLIKDLKAQHEKEKETLYKQIDKLLDKVGTQQINNYTQNIIINNFGDEDVSHISKGFIDYLLQGPYTMIQRYVEAKHFYDKKPQNKNIFITNKRSKYIKVFKNNKWILEDRKEVIEDLVDKNYTILDEHYENSGHEKLDKFQNKRYKEFQQKYDSKDKELQDRLLKESELLLINNTNTSI